MNQATPKLDGRVVVQFTFVFLKGSHFVLDKENTFLPTFCLCNSRTDVIVELKDQR